MVYVLTRDDTVLPATHTFIHKWNEPYLPLLPSRKASPHFGWYSFPVPLRVGGWVGLASTRHDQSVCTKFEMFSFTVSEIHKYD